MYPSSLFSVNLHHMFGSSLLVNLVCIISSCVVATSKRLCVRIKLQMISLSIHALKDSFSYFGSLVNVIHIKCCYASMKSTMEVKIRELIVH